MTTDRETIERRDPWKPVLFTLPSGRVLRVYDPVWVGTKRMRFKEVLDDGRLVLVDNDTGRHVQGYFDPSEVK
jgi:hypothetical protein